MYVCVLAWFFPLNTEYLSFTKVPWFPKVGDELKVKIPPLNWLVFLKF